MKTLERTHILAQIVEAKRKRLQAARIRVPEAVARRMAESMPSAPSFHDALLLPRRVRLIAELKKASPSKGVLNENLNIEGTAEIYAAGGAVAVSVVTEEDFFQGDLAWIGKARKASGLPVLRKDFVFDPFQVYETRGSGASAVLLIVAMLDLEQLKDLLALSRNLKLDALVEVHDEAELEEAIEAGATIIGVNNRNLKTFDVDLGTSFRLARMIPEDRLFVVESGIHSRDDVDALIEAGADAFLVGEHFVAAGDPAAAIRGLL
jgi:indole-3-glycerol phosphate synthase